jgi:alkylhydroperoxidase family enzyme
LQLNNCAYCLNLHYEAARGGHPPGEDRHPDGRVGDRVHSEAEQAALRHTEALTRAADTDRDAAFQRFHDALAENVSAEEILEIVGVVANMNVWTRIKPAEGAMPAPA